MSASLCMSMASLAVSGSGRGVTAARMGRAAASKGAVAGSSAFFPAKASAKMTIPRRSRVRARHPADERETRNARRRDRARDATARSGRVAFERAEARAPGSARRRRVGPRLFGPRVSGGVASPRGFFSRFSRLSFETRTILSFSPRASASVPV